MLRPRQQMCRLDRETANHCECHDAFKDDDHVHTLTVTVERKRENIRGKRGEKTSQRTDFTDDVISESNAADEQT